MVNSDTHQAADDLTASSSHKTWLNISEFITQSTATTYNPGTDTVAAESDGSNSHTEWHNFSHDSFDLAPFHYDSHEAYISDGSLGVVANDGRLWGNTGTTSTEADQFGRDGNILSTPYDFESTSSVYDMNPASADYFLSHFFSVPSGPPSGSETDEVDSQLLLFDTGSSTLPPSSNGSLYGDQTSPVSFRSSLSADINPLAPSSTLSNGEDPELESEQPFLSGGPLRFPGGYNYATIPPPTKEVEHNALGGEAAEEGAADKSSAGSMKQPERSSRPRMSDPPTSREETRGHEAGPSNSGHQPEAAASAAMDDIPCPGLSGKNKAEAKSALKSLLATAEADGVEARKAGLSKITQNGGTSKCNECGKTNRRDRSLDHVVFTHLGLKTWSCPLCRRDYSTRDALSQHIKATKVTCLCHKQITKNNWYEHSTQCEECSSVAGGLKIEKGRVVAADRIAPQAGPSVQDSLAQETETGSQECNPRPQVRSPDIGRSLKRKASETVDESGGEERNSKRARR